MTGKVSQAQLARADEVAKKNKEAANQIEQAGRGLHVAIQECLGNASTLETVAVLAAVQAYVADAIRVLLEKEQGAGAPPEKQLVIARPR
jgi:hypothetical protein